MAEIQATYQWRIRGRGSRGSAPPFGPRCRLFNIGPKVGPPPLFLLVDLRWTPVADPGCVCVTGVITLVGACECPRVGVFFKIIFIIIYYIKVMRADDVTRTMSKGAGVLVKNPVSAPGPPPPFQKSWIRPCLPNINPQPQLCLHYCFLTRNSYFQNNHTNKWFSVLSVTTRWKSLHRHYEPSLCHCYK